MVQGGMLTRLGVAWSLAAAPVVSLCLMAATAVFPNTTMICVGEIMRKVSVRPGDVACGCGLLLRCGM